MKKLALFLAVLTVSTSITACSLFNKNTSQPNTPNTQNQQQTADNKASKQVPDKDLAEQLKKEKIVKNAMVYVQNNTAVAVIVAKDGVKKEDVNALAQKYAKDLKAKYKNNKVVVQALYNKKEWINVNLD